MLHLGSLVRHGCSCSIRSYRSSPCRVISDVVITAISVACIAAAAAILAVFGLHALYYCLGAGLLTASGVFFLFSACVVGLFLKSTASRVFETFDLPKQDFNLIGRSNIYHGNSALNAKTLPEASRYLQNKLQNGEYIFYQYQPAEGAEHIIMQKMDQGAFFYRTIEVSEAFRATTSKETFIHKFAAFISPIGNKPLAEVSIAQLSQRPWAVYLPKLNHIEVGIKGENKEVFPFIRRINQSRTEEEMSIKEKVREGCWTWFILEKPSKSSSWSETLDYRLVIYSNIDGKKVNVGTVLLATKLKREVVKGEMPQLSLDPNKMPPIVFGTKVDAETLFQEPGF